MDVPPPPQEGIAHALHALGCSAVAMIAASFSSLDRRVKVRDMAFYVLFAGFAGFMMYFGMYACGVSWYLCLAIALPFGFCIYGIVGALRKSDGTVSRLDIGGWLAARYKVKVDNEEERKNVP